MSASELIDWAGLPTAIDEDVRAELRPYIPHRGCSNCRKKQTGECKGDTCSCTCGQFEYGFDLDGFQQAGIHFLSRTRVFGEAFARFIQWGWEHLRPAVLVDGKAIRDDEPTRWARFCSEAWGCDISTIFRAWQIVRTVETLPQDIPASTAYEAVANATPEQAEERLAFVAQHSLTQYQVRELKHLEPYTGGDWQTLPEFTIRDGTLYFSLNGKMEAIAKMLVAQNDTQRAGRETLMRRARIKNGNGKH